MKKVLLFFPHAESHQTRKTHLFPSFQTKEKTCPFVEGNLGKFISQVKFEGPEHQKRGAGDSVPFRLRSRINGE